MQTPRFNTAEIKSRGQLTIPKKIRLLSRLEAGRGGVEIVKILSHPTCLKNKRTCILFCGTIPKKEDV